MTERPAAGHGLNKFTAPFAKRPKVESGQSSWFKYIKIVHLVLCESFNGRHGRYSDWFLLEKRGDRSLALLNILKIFHSQLVTKWRHRYLPKTYLWLSAVLLEIIRVFENSPIICGKNPFYANLFVPQAYLIIDGVFSNRSI